MSTKRVSSDVPSILVRDSTGGAWVVYPEDCVDEQRPDGNLVAMTPGGEALVVPPVERWTAGRIYDGAHPTT